MAGTSLKEMELVARASKGDASAFEQIVRRYEVKVYNLAYRMTGNGEDASDVAQEAFLAAWEGLSGFRAKSALYTWLYRITVNKALAARRKRGSRKETAMGDSTIFEDAPGGEDPVESARRHEREKLVQDAIGSLEEEFRAVVVLKDIEGLEYHEIATVLDIAMGTVKSRLHRGRMTLRDNLKRTLGELA